MKCPKCNCDTLSEDLYCHNCHTKFVRSYPAQPYPTYQTPPPAKKASNGMAIAGFILSFFFPLFGLIFGCIGNSRANNGASGKGLSVAAILISIISIIINTILVAVLYGVIMDYYTYY